VHHKKDGLHGDNALPLRGGEFVMAITANRFQTSKVSVVKAVLRNLHI
jgi:hypothetical protein